MNPKYIKQIHYREEKKNCQEKNGNLDQGNQGKNGNFDQGNQGKMKILVREIRENYLEKTLGTLKVYPIFLDRPKEFGRDYRFALVRPSVRPSGWIPLEPLHSFF